MQVIDVVFKWICLKLDENEKDGAFSMKIYDFLAVLFDFLESHDYVLQDNEAYVIVPMLCARSGHNNTIVKNKIKNLIKQTFVLYDRQKCLALLIDIGCASRSLKAVAETLDEIAITVTRDGMSCISDKQVRQIAKLVEHSDQGVKKGALQVLGQLYLSVEEEIWSSLGKPNAKVTEMLTKRFKEVKLWKEKQQAQQSNSASKKVEQSSPPRTKVAQLSPRNSPS